MEVVLDLMLVSPSHMVSIEAVATEQQTFSFWGYGGERDRESTTEAREEMNERGAKEKHRKTPMYIF